MSKIDQKTMKRHYAPFNLDFKKGASSTTVIDYESTMMTLLEDLREVAMALSGLGFSGINYIVKKSAIMTYRDALQVTIDSNASHSSRVNAYEEVCLATSACRRIILMVEEERRQDAIDEEEDN